MCYLGTNPNVVLCKWGPVSLFFYYVRLQKKKDCKHLLPLSTNHKKGLLFLSEPDCHFNFWTINGSILINTDRPMVYFKQVLKVLPNKVKQMEILVFGLIPQPRGIKSSFLESIVVFWKYKEHFFLFPSGMWIGQDEKKMQLWGFLWFIFGCLNLWFMLMTEPGYCVPYFLLYAAKES